MSHLSRGATAGGAIRSRPIDPQMEHVLEPEFQFVR
jgi:hypothetical protein